MTLRRFRHAKDDHGATMIEFAIVVALFLSLLFVTVDFGIAFRTKLIVDNGVQAGARVGAGVGNDIDADLYILDEFLDGLAALKNGGTDILVWVEVYKVESDGSHSPANTNEYEYKPDGNPATCDWDPCPKGSTVNIINKPAWDGYVDGYSGWDWAPDNRNVVLGSLDQIGVTAYYSYDFLTGFMPGTEPACDVPNTYPTNCWTEDTILRLEPLQFAVTG